MEKITEEKVFAKGICWKKMWIIYALFCVFGVYFEQIRNLIKHFIQDGSIFWETRSGLIYGPFNPVYGLGAVLFILILATKKRPFWKTFIYGFFIGGTFEYLLSYIQEKLIGTVSWDYSNSSLNINGRTYIPYMVVWGLLAVILVDYVYPWLSNLIEKIPYKIGNVISYILITFLCFDMAISAIAVLRGHYRKEGYSPITFIGTFCDNVYTDERLHECFPNMRINSNTN